MLKKIVQSRVCFRTGLLLHKFNHAVKLTTIFISFKWKKMHRMHTKTLFTTSKFDQEYHYHGNWWNENWEAHQSFPSFLSFKDIMKHLENVFVHESGKEREGK